MRLCGTEAFSMSILRLWKEGVGTDSFFGGWAVLGFELKAVPLEPHPKPFFCFSYLIDRVSELHNPTYASWIAGIQMCSTMPSLLVDIGSP
jgi:hypothetical protein